MSKKSRELREKGVDVINLSLGEPDFDTPAPIKEAAKKAIDENYTRYSPVAGFAKLREAIAVKFSRENGLDYSPCQIVVSTGAKQSIANVILSLVGPGDEVLLPSPYWVTYKDIIRLAEGKPVILPTTIENNFKIAPEEIAGALTSASRMLILNSPCNPTGSVYRADELEAMTSVIRSRRDLYVLSDEIYEHIIFRGKHVSIAGYKEIVDRVVIVNGVSKAFAMTGWRIGYLAASEPVARACEKVQGQMTSGASSVSQMAALAALTSPPSLIEPMRKCFEKRCALVLSGLMQLPGVRPNKPDGAFYVFPDVSHYFGTSSGKHRINGAEELCMYLLEEARVALVPGEGFGEPRCIRISYAAGEDKLKEALERIKIALGKLS